MILIPGLVSNACVILRNFLTNNQIESCRTIIYRAYARIDGDPNGSMGAMTGYFRKYVCKLHNNGLRCSISMQVRICLMCRQEQ